MNQEKFLKELELLLSDISDVEREEAMEYYRCYFEDAGKENESRVLRELGSPKKVADMIKTGLRDSGETGVYTETGYHIGEQKDIPAGWNGTDDRDMERKLQKNNDKVEKKLEKSRRKIEKKKNKIIQRAEKKEEKIQRRKYRQEQKQYQENHESWVKGLLVFPWLIISIVMICVMVAVIVSAVALAVAIGGSCVVTWITAMVLLGFAVAALAGGIGLSGTALLAITFFVMAAGILLLAALAAYSRKVMPGWIQGISRVTRSVTGRMGRGEE